ncbi:MAG: type II secretion system protein [Candidatus Sumerlaeota bacterium]|nr:type II secretion system protein [Candidatus Sumerlaeota bacterium]
MNRNRAFTLIELLIVVGIIAILAAIAVPNFLEAQTRAKVSRVASDFHALHTALECYCVDNNTYPQRTSKLPPGRWWQTALTTPIAYVSSALHDPFCVDDTLANEHYQYAHCIMMRSFITVSVGPDTKDQFDEKTWMCGMRYYYPAEYDPTNGTTSAGDIWKVSKQGGPIRDM